MLCTFDTREQRKKCAYLERCELLIDHDYGKWLSFWEKAVFYIGRKTHRTSDFVIVGFFVVVVKLEWVQHFCLLSFMTCFLTPLADFGLNVKLEVKH